MKNQKLAINKVTSNKRYLGRAVALASLRIAGGESWKECDFSFITKPYGFKQLRAAPVEAI